MTKINYVVAVWGGRLEAPANIQLHLDLINKLENNIDQVTLVSPPYPGQQNIGFEKTLKRLDGITLDGGAKVVVLKRTTNDHMSYGSWSDAYGAYRQEFDYYIFMEDDYIPARPNFDTILVDILEAKQCHYLCMLVSSSQCTSVITKKSFPHAGVTVGICKSTAMEVIWERFGSLLSNDFEDWYWHNQMNFSYPYTYCGFSIADFADQYAVPFWHKNSLMHFVQGDKYLLVPKEHQVAVRFD